MRVVPARCSISHTPEELASRLSHLDGFVFLDSADAGAGETGRISLISACPRRFHGGHLSHSERLRSTLRSRAQVSPDWGLPTGGLFGYVEFDGRYRFGEYDGALIYRHDVDEWIAAGNTEFLRQAREPWPENGASPLLFRPDTPKESFLAGVRQAQEWIAAGDIYQVNLSHRFSAWGAGSPYARYQRLRAVSPMPHAAYLNFGDRQILSASPESFLRLSGRVARTRPIKGTRPRDADPVRDERSALELAQSAKETAELVMITDLERNDLGQICEYGSVRVTELLKLERFPQVFHLVSTVEGLLRGDRDHLDALRACSPGGSISGAPKKRALEIIRELEPLPRGLYTGAIGYLGFNGESQFSIAIRTLIHERGHWHFHVGAGIVADSSPEAEYEETLHKAAGIFHACGSASGLARDL